MTNTVSFRNFESLPHLRFFIEDYLEMTIGQFLHNRPLNAKVIVEKRQFKSGDHSHPHFLCEIVLYHPVLRKPLVARKSSTNFYKSVRETCRAVEKSLRRLAQTKSKRRHRNYEYANLNKDADEVEGSEL